MMAPVDDVETYCDNGIWKTRWRHSTKPFAAGGGKERQISQGATVAIWYGVDHIITNPDGSTAEHNSYRYRREHDCVAAEHGVPSQTKDADGAAPNPRPSAPQPGPGGRAA
jgi:hypothetical protein